jgi:hypothetical protein
MVVRVSFIVRALFLAALLFLPVISSDFYDVKNNDVVTIVSTDNSDVSLNLASQTVQNEC